MITTRMKSEEILKEFWREYRDTIKPRILGWIGANKKSIVRSPEKFKDSRGFVILPEPRQIKTDKGNTYRCKLRVRLNKNYTEFITTTYTIILDSITGKNKVIVLPSAEDHNYLILLDSHTLQRYNALVLKRPDIDFTTLVDEFIKADNKFTLQYDIESNSKIINSYLEFGNDYYGISQYNEKTKTVDIRTFVLGSDLRKWQQELKLKEFLPHEIYQKHKEMNKIFESIIYPNINSEKERQMKEAWEEYERRR